MLDTKLNYESSKLKQEAHNELFKKSEGIISKIDYEQTLLSTIQLKQRWEIQQEILTTMNENIHVQQEARMARLNKMRKELERAQQQVNNLKIYATIDIGFCLLQSLLSGSPYAVCTIGFTPKLSAVTVISPINVLIYPLKNACPSFWNPITLYSAPS